MDTKKINPIIEEGIKNKTFKRVAMAVRTESDIFSFNNTGSDLNSINKFDLASITKSVVYTALWVRSLKDGFSLDDNVSRYLPELSGKYSEKLTLRHLMTNSCYFNIRPFQSYEDLNALENDLMVCGQKFEPGTQVEYTNTPALLAGFILKKIMGIEDLQTAVGLSIHRDGGLDSESDFDLRYDSQHEIAIRSNQESRPGQIHDPLSRMALERSNSYIGVSGMFGSAEGLADFGSYFFTNELGQKIASNILSDRDYYLGGHSALNAPGFYMWPGEYTGFEWFDKNSFFTYGYTGCLLVVCPERNLSISFCSNSRYYPDPKGTRSSDLKNLRLDAIREVLAQL